jgi:hypothetical protein
MRELAKGPTKRRRVKPDPTLVRNATVAECEAKAARYREAATKAMSQMQRDTLLGLERAWLDRLEDAKRRR